MTTVLIIVICLLARKQNKTVFPKMSNYSLKRLNLQSCLWNVTFQKSGRRLILLQCDWDWLPHFIHNALVFRLEPSPLGILANQSHVFPQEQTGGCPVKLRLEWGMFIFSEWTHGGCLTSSLALAGAFQSLKKKKKLHWWCRSDVIRDISAWLKTEFLYRKPALYIMGFERNGNLESRRV